MATLTLSVVAPDRSVVEEPISSLVAPGTEGYFGIQAGHIPFVAALKPCLLEYTANNQKHFVYIGGNDSADTVRIVSEEAAKAGYPLRSIHIPKTIDNDLVGNDHTPGFPSAARFVGAAISFSGRFRSRTIWRSTISC